MGTLANSEGPDKILHMVALLADLDLYCFIENISWFIQQEDGIF